jgi:hypothetical protein
LSGHPGASLFDPFNVAPERRSGCGGRKIAANDASGGQQVTVVRVKRIDLLVNEAAHIVRNRFERFQRGSHVTLNAQLIDDAHHEKGITAAPLE